MRPFFERDGVTIYCGDCREILPELEEIDSIITDPPYGKGERTDRASRGRSNATKALDFPPIYGDDVPFEPIHLLAYRRIMLWGANYYADKLPSVSSWLVWDKREGVASDDNADCELAWTNFGGRARLFRHLWKGMIKASERGERRVHPTQKPVALMRWCIGLAKPRGVICDPYMGSGSTLRAAVDMGWPVIGIEIEEMYCKVAVKRMQQRSIFEMAARDASRGLAGAGRGGVAGAVGGGRERRG
jgi:site-specific DNA-methyltransferase (adenine-specific)/modification methylase